VTVLLLSLAFFVGFVSLPVLYATLSYNEQFGVVIDAGSSHTQVFLYTWKLPFFNNTGQVHENAHCLIPGGISTYSNATEAANSIHGCVKNVLERIPEPVRNSKEHPNNYVWFGATGGMRLLEQENKNLSDEILDKIKENIKDLGSTSDVGILSGKEEALYGWISSNYINGTFRKKLVRKVLL
jgi:apyrase